MAFSNRSGARLQLNRADDADRLLARAISEAEARGIRFPLVYLKIASAKLYLHRKDYRRALDEASSAIDIASSGTYPLDLGAAHRILGEVHVHKCGRAAALVL